RGLSLLVVCDTSTNRLGLRAWFEDLGERLRHRVQALDIAPPIREELWERPRPRMQHRDWDSLVPRLHYPLVLRRRLQEHRPDLMVVATGGMLGLSAARLARARGIPLLVAAPPALAIPKPQGWENNPID